MGPRCGSACSSFSLGIGMMSFCDSWNYEQCLFNATRVKVVPGFGV
jgi:hypothetical protein